MSEATRSESERLNQREMQTENTNSTDGINTISTPVSTTRPTVDTAVPSPPVNTARPSINTANAFEEHLFERFSPFKNAFSLPPVPNISSMDNTGIFRNAYEDEDVEEEVDMNNVNSSYTVPDTSFTKFHKDRPKDQIEEEVYVCQPPGFEDPHFPNKVYKVEKALYGLHQAPRAWYETLSTYLLDNGFHRGQIDKTLFIRRHKEIYPTISCICMLYIIFGSTKKEMSIEFEKLMHDKFQMSSMGELSFFLGLQVKQKSDGIFISQDKYVAEILKKFDLASIKIASTPMETNKPLTKDEKAENVDVHSYRSMIGSLMYLTASRPDIMFVVCAYARFQVTPKTSHLHAVKRIFIDYAGASLDRKSTTRGLSILARIDFMKCKK
ncbi:putative ribonuclease H-like domain-containing protein [Tanacetum coccineum]